MIVGYLLLGVFASCGAFRPPRRGAFAPAPEINSDVPLMVEGDIAVLGLGSGTARNASPPAQDSLWPGGVVPYRIATVVTDGGLVEPVFLDRQIENITTELRSMESTWGEFSCLEFR